MVARRIAAVILGIILIFVTWFSLISLRVNDTVLSSGFYVSQLRDADAFNFFYDDLLPLLIDEASEEETLDRDIDLREVKPQIIQALRETLPPDWLQEQAEAAIEAFFPYLVGKTDEFVIEVPIADRIRGAGPAFKKATTDGAFVDLLYDDVVTPEVEEAFSDASAVPLDLSLTAGEVVEIFRRVATDAWLHLQIANAIDEVIPYFAGDAEHFTVTIRPEDRIDVARGEIKGVLAGWDARAFLFDEIVDPVVETNIGESFGVPFNLTVTSQEVQSILRDILTEDWIRLRVDQLVDTTTDYLSGRTETFSMVVPLSDRKVAAVTSVGRLTDARLEALYPTIRECTAQELRTINLLDFARTGIACRPPGTTLEQLKAVVSLTNFDAEVTRLVDLALPDTFTLTQAETRATIGEEQWSVLQDIRGWVRDGFTFTDVDLEGELAEADFTGRVPYDDLDAAGRQAARDQSGNVDAFRDALRDITDGRFTQDDLRDRMREGNSDAYDDFQDGREDLDSMRSGVSFLAWLVPALLLVSVGMLGGRSIPAKVMWAAAFLAVPSVILFAVAGPGYTSGYRDDVEREIDESIASTDLDTPSERAITEKGADIGLNAVDDILSGLSSRALILMVVSLVALGGSIGYYWWEKRRPPPDGS